VRTLGPLYNQVPAEAFEQQLAHGKEGALVLFDKHKHHLGDVTDADNARTELKKKLVAQNKLHHSRYHVVWVRFLS
jgi:hypothetical protein